MKVIDNFLSPYYFKSLQNVLMGGDFPWYYTVSQYSKDNKLVLLNLTLVINLLLLFLGMV